MPSIKMNGKKKTVKSVRIDKLLAELDINTTGILVQVNGRMIKWTQYSRCRIKDKNIVEILRFTGGG